MRRILTILAAVILSTTLMPAQNDKEVVAVFERTYVSTDKDSYVAGDRVWCSAFCFDVRSKTLSNTSAIAYVEVLSPYGDILQSAKISIEGGRGGGYLDLPESMPTGNYRLIAFTSVNRNEEGYDFLQNSKVISVLNSKSQAKVKDNVEIVSDEIYSQRKETVKSDAQTGDLAVKVPGFTKEGSPFSIDIENTGSKPVSLSVSVYHEDAVAAPEDKSIASFVIPSVQNARYTPEFKPETEGEIILATLSGKDRNEILSKETTATAYISSAGRDGDTYTSPIHPDGTISFSTNNIYGNRELVTEIADLNDEKLIGLIDIQSPFVSVSSDVPLLSLSEGLSKAVVERGRQMQRFRMEYSDSLAQFKARKEDFPYVSPDANVYILDDYTRFPTIREVLVEITTEVRVRGRNDKQRIQVLTKDLEGDSGASMSWENSLVLLDGVPVFKHKDMMDYDAMLLKEIHVWREKYVFGNRTFYGVVNFISKRGNMAFMDFGSNVRIVDFQGVCYPMEFTKKYAKDGNPDTRQTIFWKPEVEVGPQQSISLDCEAPDYFGRFSLVVEGVTQDGEYIHKKATFVVE